MDALRPGHAHRSSSDRLLSNYLDAQKALSTSLLTLLSHSHSSTSSLLAYTTSSPGVQIPVRRAVRHAAFEGPLSAHLVENPEAHLDDENPESPGWAAYVSSLDRFRKDLKQIHMLEEEMSRVRRDREILVTRLIKSTKSRPKKADLTAMSQEYGQHSHRSPSSMSSRASTLSISSAGSFNTKESKRANKLAEAQAELLGCEEHLRGLEVRIESERNSVMQRGLEERFRAMEAVGRMWVRQARRGLDDLEKIHDLPRDAFELDSNGSLAPSQSASQIGYEDASPRRGGVPFPRGVQGSITGSIQEEDEGSSDDGNGGNYVVHENRPQSMSANSARPGGGAGAGGPPRPGPIGVPSVTAPRTGGRRAASDIGYNPPTNRRQSLRRTFSNEHANERADSDASSVRDMGGKKKKGFFSSLKSMFKGNNSNKRDQQRRSGRDSPGPVYQSNKGGWSTRTDGNLKRSNSSYGRGGRGDDSSDDEDQGNLVAVSNNRDSKSFSVDNLGRQGGGVGRGGSIKRSSTMPIASGLIPAKPGNRNSMGAGKRTDSQSTLTAKRTGATSPDPVGGKTPTQRPASRASTVKSGGAPPASGGVYRSGTVKSASVGNVSRSNTVKSTASASTAKSGGTAATGTKSQRIRPNGSIARAEQVSEGRTIMSIVDMDQPPPMPDVPKAPKSHVTPQLELPKAPGSSLVPPVNRPAGQQNGQAAPGKSLSRSNSAAASLARSNSSKRVSQAPVSPPRSTTPLPPSRLLAPPLKSALRPTSPSPNSSEGKLDQGPPPQMFSISAPGPVQLPAEEKPAPAPAPAATPAAQPELAARPGGNKRNSYHSMTTDGESIYESAEEGGNEQEEEDSSSEEEDISKYQVYENDRSVEAGRNAGPPRVERIPSHEYDDDSGDETDNTATGGTGARAGEARDDSSVDMPRLVKRKSVRMNVPESPTVHAPPPVTDQNDQRLDYSTEDRAPSPEPQRPDSGAWSSRIGQADIDSEEERDAEYNSARKGLMKNTGKWEAVKQAATASPKRKKSVKSSKAGSVRSR